MVLHSYQLWGLRPLKQSIEELLAKVATLWQRNPETATEEVARGGPDGATEGESEEATEGRRGGTCDAESGGGHYQHHNHLGCRPEVVESE